MEGRDAALPVASRWRPQREAAGRNEEAILGAAKDLFATRPVTSVDVREIAREAGVGVGTVYRRFGDRAGLLAAVIGGEERRLQEAVLGGPPPLGPGAPAGERLNAFLTALAALTEANLGVLLAVDAQPPGWQGTGAHAGWRHHLSNLLAELRPDLDPTDRGWYAEALLGPLAPFSYAAQRERGLAADRIAANLLRLAEVVAVPSEKG